VRGHAERAKRATAIDENRALTLSRNCFARTELASTHPIASQPTRQQACPGEGASPAVDAGGALARRAGFTVPKPAKEQPAR